MDPQFYRPAAKIQTRTLETERKKTKRGAKKLEKARKKRFLGHSLRFFDKKVKKKARHSYFFSYLCSANERRTK